MRSVRVVYHNETDTWWAESPDVPGFSAAAESLDDLRELVRTGLTFHLGDQIEIFEETARAGLVATVSYVGVSPATRSASASAEGLLVVASSSPRAVPVVKAPLAS